MTIIYFAGRDLEASRFDKYTALDRHAVIRGYDIAGNLLSTIYYEKMPTTAYIDPEFTYQTWYTVDTHYDRWGVAYPSGYTINNTPRITPHRIAADAAGFLYVASSPIQSYVHGGGVDYNYSSAYHDWFRKYRRNGDRVPFPQLHGGAIEALALAADGSIFVGGAAVRAGENYYTLRKYDADGVLIWSAGSDAPIPTNDTVLDMVLDASEDVYILAQYTYFPGTGMTCRLAKYDGSDGSLIWRRWINNGSDRNKMVLYDGHVYLAANGKYYYVDDLVVLPSTIETADTADVVAYERIAGVPQNYFITQWDMTDGSFIGGMSQTEIETPADSAIGGAYYLSWCPVNEQFLLSVIRYYGGYLSGNDFYLQTYEADFTFVSEVNVNSYVPPGIRIDSSGNRYWIRGRQQVSLGTTHAPSYSIIYGAYHFHTYDIDGVAIWANLNALGTPGRWYYDAGAWPNTGTIGWVIGGVTYSGTYLDLHNAYDNIPDCGDITGSLVPLEYWTVYDVFVVEGTETPALAFPISLGAVTWQGDRYDVPPGLAFTIGLSAVTWIREYVGAYAPPTIYRAVLTGSPDLELPLASFQCRRTAEGQTQVSLIVPSSSLTLLDAITARSSGDLIIRKGIRFSDGTEQLDELLRVVLTGVRYDAGTKSATLSLTGSDATETSRLMTRTLRGISYRNTSGDGIRRVRCEVDTWLRPGDTADLGSGETFVVSDLVYSVSPSSAVMEVVERAT